MRNLFLWATAGALLATPVLGADIAPLPPPLPAPPPPAPHVYPLVRNWSGFYVGGSVGDRSAGATWRTTCIGLGVAGNICPGTAAGLPARVAFNNPANFNSWSARGGLYGGYNWQFSLAGVIGLEGDWAGGLNNATISGIPGAEITNTASSPGNDRSSVKQTWDAGIRGRIGFLAMPSLLLFATGGISWATLQASAFCGTPQSGGPPPTGGGWCTAGGGFVGSTSSFSRNVAGWTAGAGLEWMLALQWLVRGEYRYADYGSVNGIFFQGTDAIAASVRLHTHTALLGIAYKFGGGLPPVAPY